MGTSCRAERIYLFFAHTNQIDVFCSEGGNTKMDEILAIQLNIQNEETMRETDV